MKARVLRAFLVGGERQEVGTTIELPDRAARELAWIGKLEPVEEEPPDSGPMTTESAAELVGGKPARAEERPPAPAPVRHVIEPRKPGRPPKR
jgi:hypothetical protein